MLQTTLTIITAGYIALLFLISWLASKNHDNNAFFRGSRNSPWWAVAFGMIGASISGVTFVSVPGMVRAAHMTYLQTCMGFVFGYAIVAFVLLPIYYRMNLTSIYTYLQHRFGVKSYMTGAFFFFFSKLIGASIRLFLVCLILQRLIFDAYGFPFAATAFIIILLIWLYTRKSGIKTIVWSDCLQTIVMLLALVAIMFTLCERMGITLADAVNLVSNSDFSQVMVLDDTLSKQYFWKQFFSGIFIVIVMTGLDQDMMQKNLTCKTLRQSQLNMCVNGTLYLPVNALFLFMGALAYLYCERLGFALPAASDELLPTLCAGNMLGTAAILFFTVGIVAAAFSSADSAMTSLTTSCCVDMFRRPDDERLRKMVHPMIGLLIFLLILLVQALNSTSVIDAIYTVCGYTYGPLLGLFTFGIFTRRQPRERFVPWICIASPLLCYGIDAMVQQLYSYKFGYELLMLNGMFTFVGLLLSSAKLRTDNAGGNSNV